MPAVGNSGKGSLRGEGEGAGQLRVGPVSAVMVTHAAAESKPTEENEEAAAAADLIGLILLSPLPMGSSSTKHDRLRRWPEIITPPSLARLTHSRREHCQIH